MERILLIFKTNIFLPLVCFVLLLVGILLWKCVESTEEFGLNFTTEILGVILTVFVINKIIKDRQKRHDLPKKLAQYEEVRLYTNRYISFWTEAYRNSVPDNGPETIENFFSEQGIGKIFDYLHLDSTAMHRDIKWWDFAQNHVQEYKLAGNQILNRHSESLDPSVYRAIYELTESMFNQSFGSIKFVKNMYEERGIPRVEILRDYVGMIPTNTDIEAVLELLRWCNETYDDLHKHDPNLGKVFKYIPAESRTQLNNMIPEEIRIEQMAAKANFQQP